jgi:hypothetical protein
MFLSQIVGYIGHSYHSKNPPIAEEVQSSDLSILLVNDLAFYFQT